MSEQGDSNRPRSGEDLELQRVSVRSAPSTRSVRSASPRKTPRTRSTGHASASPSELRPGMELQRYVLLKRLGRGGMGEVFLAYDPQLDRRLALKVLRDETLGSRYLRLDRERLRREAKALGRLSHPNVVTIYDVGTIDDRTFIAMELVEGLHFGRWLRKEKRPLDRILAVLLDAGRGLSAAHAAGIVHRDFKPSNVMVGEDGRVCVLDFGLALDHEAPAELIDLPRPTENEESEVLTQPGITVGTPPYMPPEQHLGLAIDARSDQFSFCVSIFEAVVGQRPFPGRDSPTLLEAKQGGHMLPVPDGVAMPPWLLELIHRGLRPAPEDRFASIDELLLVLEQHARPRPRHRSYGLTALGVGGLVMAGLAWSMTRVPSPCELGRQRASVQWNETRAQQIRQAFAATELSYAQTSFERVAEGLDEYVESWEADHRHACTTAPASAQDTASLDRRLQCLERSLEQLEATTAVLGDANADTVRRATRMVAALPPVSRCEQQGQHPSGSAPPPSPVLAMRVDELRARWATARVLQEAGRYREGLSLARGVLDQAVLLNYPPLQIEARLLVGQLLADSGEAQAAVEPLTEAALAAQALPYEQMAVQAMVSLVMVLGVDLARTDEATTWAGHARAGLRRAPDVVLEAKLWTVEAAVQMAAGHYAEAQQRGEEALRRRREALGDDHPDVVGAHNNLANALWRQGQLEKAEHHYTQALAIAEQAHGTDHPLVATLLQNLGGLLGAQGQFERAREVLDRGLQIRRRALGPRHPDVANMLNNLGSVRWRLGHGDDALAMIHEALAIHEEALGTDSVKLVPLLHNLAELQGKTDADGGRRHALRALDLLDRFRGPDHPRKVHTLSLLGRIAIRAGDLEEAREYLDQGLALTQRAPDVSPPLVATVYDALGKVEMAAEQPRVAAEHFEHALKLQQQVGHTEDSLAEIRFSLARALRASGDPDDRVEALVRQAESAAGKELRAEIAAWRAEPPAEPPPEGNPTDVP